MSNPRRLTSIILLTLLLPAAGYYGYHAYQQLHLDDYSASQGGAVADQTPWEFPSEEAWLADETSRDIAELLAFAKNPASKVDLKTALTPKATNSYDLTANFDGVKVSKTLALQESIWSPSDYSAWARDIIAEVKLTPAARSAAAGDLACARTLTNPTPKALMAEGQRLSEALTKTPLDPSLHEQAALLISCFAMREARHDLTNYRRELCRATAHLAIARALDPDSRCPQRDIAEVALATLAERGGPALAMLKSMENPASPETTAWVNALRVRNSRDWRADRDGLTLLEKVEIFRAQVGCVTNQFALNWLRAQGKDVPPVPDWQRILINEHCSVSEGHLFIKNSIAQTGALLQQSWLDYHGTRLPSGDVVKVLNEPAGRCVMPGGDGKPELRVLGWDFWAGQQQRQLVYCFRRTNDFLRNQWGVNDYKGLQKYVNDEFSGLTLFPLVAQELTDGQKDFSAISKRAKDLVMNHPELVNPAAWASLNKPGDNDMPALSLPDPSRWTRCVNPFGTAFEFQSRCYYFCVPENNEPEKWAKLIALAPTDYEVLYSELWKKYRDNPPPTDVAEKSYATVLPYSLRAMKQVAKSQHANSPRYPETMQKICKLDPDLYFGLGDYHADRNESELAAAAYLKGVELSPDRVSMANNCRWLVNYLEDQGRKDEALKIANEAAEVYSSSGLITMALLLEKRGQLTEAEKYVRKIEERYENKSVMDSFYLRNRNAPAYQKQGMALLAKSFPQGMETIALADLKEPPKDGVLLKSDSKYTRKAGVAAGEIFVGYDGTRLRSVEQYDCMQQSSVEPKMTFLVWNPRSGAYREIKTKLADRRFYAKMETWKPK